ncbi:hypothetical protein PMAYCL1PPCAC_08775, partial [Pristionchus mayeri]
FLKFRYFREFSLDVICKIALGMRGVRMFSNEFMPVCKEMIARPLSHPVTALASLFPFAVDEIHAFLKLLSKLSTTQPPFFILTAMLKRAIKGDGTSTTRDFIDIFLDAEVDASEVDYGDGAETTANFLAFVVHFLANHEDVQQTLAEEL